jgi:hypothetical protein
MAVFLAWKCPDFRDYSRLGKGTIPENSCLGTRTLNHFQIFRNIAGRGRGISGKITVWEHVHNTNFQKSLENSGYSKKFLQPTERNCIPGQEKLITDIRAGARNSPFNFVSLVVKQRFHGRETYPGWVLRVSSMFSLSLDFSRIIFDVTIAR